MNLDALTLEQLYELNDKVCQRIDQLIAQKDLKALQQIRLGMKVSFNDKSGIQTGTVIKINKKSVIVVSEDGLKQYKIAPGLLSPCA